MQQTKTFSCQVELLKQRVEEQGLTLEKLKVHLNSSQLSNSARVLHLGQLARKAMIWRSCGKTCRIKQGSSESPPAPASCTFFKLLPCKTSCQIGRCCQQHGCAFEHHIIGACPRGAK